MAKLKDLILQKRRETQETARRDYIKLLRRSERAQVSDAEGLEKLMGVLGLTMQDVDRDLAVMQRARALEPLGAKLQDRLAAHDRAAKEFNDFSAAMETTVKDMERQKMDLGHEANRLGGEVGQARRAIQELAELRRDYAELLAPL